MSILWTVMMMIADAISLLVCHQINQVTQVISTPNFNKSPNGTSVPYMGYIHNHVSLSK